MRHLGSRLTGALKGLMGHAVSVSGGCFNNIMRGGNIARSMSSSLGGFVLSMPTGMGRGVSGLHITSTVARMFAVFGHYGGCVSRAVP